ncbi:MAG: 2-octaprenyl-6-methoxyphenyl hydroxylase [Betaproteobacteria bacterium]|nr:MAG: 2-octaprenyl-6-methoxyphenyl hydroxylase [Betaproteobacteria bacterium]
MSAEAVDILIAGGGPVGAALALALEGSGRSVVLAEARGTDSSGPRSAARGDARAIALSYSSRLIIERLQAWSQLPVTPIETIHISQQGGFGRTVIRAADCDLSALGYVVNYTDLQQSLLAAPSTAERLFGAKVAGFDGGEAIVQTAEGERVFAPRLTVFADGARVADDNDVPVYTKDYRQTALVAWVKTEQEHNSRAWERFTPDGPLALLPHASGHALVWTSSPERSAQLAALDTAAFLFALQTAFGERLGAFTDAGARSTFPLMLRYRREETQPRSVSVGNAAQSLHPVAGQGFNLGLRDAWELARLVRDAREPGSAGFVDSYRRARALDRRAGIGFTDSLVGLFSNSNALLGLGRGAGLLALDLLPFARRFVARRMIYGARGLP